MRLDQALDLYVQQLQADGRSGHTIQQYRRYIRFLDSWLGGASHVGGITHQDLARFLTSPEARNRPDGKPKKATSMNGLRSSLRTFFAYTHAAGITPQNPARLVRRARCAPAPPRALSRDEQDRLLAVLRAAKGDEAERDRVLFELMLATGVRIGSALALDIEDVDLERGELYLRSTKGNVPFVVYINDRIRELLRRHMNGHATGPLFESRHGTRLSARQVQRRLATWCLRAGFERAVSPHSLRHSFAMRLYRRAGDILIVKQALGHRSIESTLVYAFAYPDALRRAVRWEGLGHCYQDRRLRPSSHDLADCD